MLNLNDLAEQSLTIAKQRGLNTDTISTLKHCAGEAGEVVEATEAFTVVQTSGDFFRAQERKELFASELADIIICVLTASAKEGIDIEKAVNEAMMKNAKRAYGGQK